MAAEIRKLNDDNMDQVSGGYIFNSSGLYTDDHENTKTPWEVLDNNGNVMVVNGRELRFTNQQDAAQAARENNVSDAEVDWDWVKGRRGIL